MLLMTPVLPQPGSAAPAARRPLLNEPPPLYSARLTLLPESDLEDFGDATIVELDADHALAYFHTPRGSVDLRLRVHFAAIPDATELELPTTLLHLAPEIGWTIRPENDTALRLRAAPGIYSDLDALRGRSFNMPLRIALLQGFTPDLAGILGAEMRPGFHTPVMPLIGVSWTPAANLRIDAQLPESRVMWSAVPDWSTAFGLVWQSRGFALTDDDDRDRDDVTLEDWRAYIEAARHVNIDFSVSARLGFVFNRRVVFGDGADGLPESSELDNHWFIAVGCAGPF